MKQETKDWIWDVLSVITFFVFLIFMTYSHGKSDGIKQAYKQIRGYEDRCGKNRFPFPGYERKENLILWKKDNIAVITNNCFTLNEIKDLIIEESVDF